MNGAAEAILEQLLAQAQAQTQLLQNLAKAFTGSGSGGGGIGGAAGSIANLGRVAGVAGVAVRAVAAGFNLLSNVASKLLGFFGSLVGAVVNVIDALVNFGKKAIETGVRLSDFFKALESVPILGKVFAFFSGIVKSGETLLDNYRNLSRAGATFGGNLTDLTKAGANANLTLGELSRVVKENSAAFATLGAGNVQIGLNKFLDAQNKLMGPGSPYAKSILGLGVTSEEAAGFLSTVIRSQGILGRENQLNSDSLAKKTNEYIVQLDTLTRLTGVQREELDRTIREAQNEQAFQVYMDSLERTQRDAAQAMLNAAAPFGKETVEEVKARLRGLDVPVTKTGETLAVFGQGAILQGQALRDAVQRGDANAFRIALGFLSESAQNYGEFLEGIPTELQASGALDFGPVQAFIAFFRRTKTQGLEKTIDEAALQQADALANSAAEFAETEKAVRLMGMAIGNVYFTLVGGLLQPLSQVGMVLSNIVTDLVGSKGFQEAIQAITYWIVGAFGEISAAFKEGGFKAGIEAILKKIGEGLSNVWDFVKAPIKEMFQSLISWLKPYFLDLVDTLMTAMLDYLGIGNAERRKYENEMNSAARHMQYLNETYLSKLPAGEERNKYLEEFNSLRDMHSKAKVQFDRLDRESAERNINAAAVMAGGVPITLPAETTPVRHSGTIGMTGNWWEKESGPVNIQAGETVLTQSQLAQIVDTAGSNKLAMQVEQLNSLTAKMLSYLKETADNTARTHRAAEALNGNLMVG